MSFSKRMPRGHGTFLNSTWTELTGFTTAESLGKPCSDFVAPEDRQRYLDAFHTLLENQDGDYRDQIRYLTKNGEHRWLEVHTQLMVASHGSLVGTAGTLSDRSTSHPEAVPPLGSQGVPSVQEPQGDPQASPERIAIQ